MSPNITMLGHYLLHEGAGLSIAGITIEDLEYVREGADQHLARLALSLTNQRVAQHARAAYQLVRWWGP
jgi:hypothetical protein